MPDPEKSSPKETNSLSRKSFLKQIGVAGAAFTIVPRHVLGGSGFIPPSDTLYIAGIGAGGKGHHDMRQFSSHTNVKIAAFCDVDERQVARSQSEYPDASFYKDFREMLEQERDNIDAVSVSTPDHNHAIQAMPAIQMGKHVYVQKPMTHDIYEARMLTEAAAEYKVVTQMGNQGSSGEGVRKLTEWYQAGLIGDVEEVWIWTDRPVWPQGIQRPGPAPIPGELDWNLWLGTAPRKSYFENLVPFNWRGWWDYGTGALGDIGCHMIETPYAVLGLHYPDKVECSVGSVYTGPFQRAYFPESCPPSSHVVLNFPAQDGKKNITLHW
ncbi:MAG: Gfo/Idh/MocA family oxidoreductase, partial [Balneolales bacterium]|nr:Gfo/Idh/MocA family oxidoreductase [Balneolales bacterium]